MGGKGVGKGYGNDLKKCLTRFPYLRWRRKGINTSILKSTLNYSCFSTPPFLFQSFCDIYIDTAITHDFSRVFSSYIL